MENAGILAMVIACLCGMFLFIAGILTGLAEKSPDAGAPMAIPGALLICSCPVANFVIREMFS